VYFTTLLKSVVVLYVDYLGRATLRHEIIEGRLNPVASGKVYELWILSKLLKYLRGVAGPRGLLRRRLTSTWRLGPAVLGSTTTNSSEHLYYGGCGCWVKAGLRR
jgi:hypothetical protein